jgi:hypothetical protein
MDEHLPLPDSNGNDNISTGGGSTSSDRVHITTKSASATAAAHSDRTNSSSITSTSSGNSAVGNSKKKSNSDNLVGSEDMDQKDVSTSHVSFGSVHVHEHRMTLGTNPEVSYGVPVELAWAADASDMYDSIEEFERKAHHLDESQQNNIIRTNDDGTTATNIYVPVTHSHTVHRLKASDRDEIAARHHSRDSIVRVKQEVQKIQEQRHDSMRDKEPIQMIKEIRQQRMEGKLTTTTFDDTTTPAPVDHTSSTTTTATTNAKPPRRGRRVWFLCCPF